MINHISIGIQDTEKVANILAELWSGYVMPFSVARDSWIELLQPENYANRLNIPLPPKLGSANLSLIG